MHEHVVVRVVQHQQVVHQGHEVRRSLGDDQLCRLGGNHDLRGVLGCRGRPLVVFLRARFGRGSGLRVLHHPHDILRRARVEAVWAGRAFCAVPDTFGDVEVVVIAVADQRVGRVDDGPVGAVLDLALYGLTVDGDQEGGAITVDDFRRRGLELLRGQCFGLGRVQRGLQFSH